MTNKPITGIAAMLGLLALAPLLAACNESSAKDQASQAQPAFSQEARTAAEARLRSELRGDVAFRQVGSFTQAAADTVAVCGQLALNGGPDTGFVALVSRQQDGSLTVEPHVATDNVSATRVFVETRSRCVADAAAMPASRRGAPLSRWSNRSRPSGGRLPKRCPASSSQAWVKTSRRGGTISR